MDSYKDTRDMNQASGSGRMGGFPLARQTSIYSLTLEEFQNSLGGPAKDFGSMNMDELLKNIWSAEENQAITTSAISSGDLGLARQGSLTLSRTLSKKTVDEVWKDIHKDPVKGSSSGHNKPQRQVTYKEMTLEDFLIKAGVVREESIIALNNPNNGTSELFGRIMNSNNINNNTEIPARKGTENSQFNSSLNNHAMQRNMNPLGLDLGFSNNGQAKASNGISFSPPVSNGMKASFDSFRAVQGQPDWFSNLYGPEQTAKQQLPQQQFLEDVSAFYASPVKRNRNGAPMDADVRNDFGQLLGNGYQVQQGKPGVCITASPINAKAVETSSPVAGPDGMNSSESPMQQYSLDGGLRNRRSRASVDKIVERRQRRMIKNRESAARSRARKQAYTVELEAEVSQLKEENKELRKRQEELSERRKRQFIEIMSSFSQNSSKKARPLRRTRTGPW